MEFTYMDSPLQIALGTLLERAVERVTSTENEQPLPGVELPEDWNDFSVKLFSYQTEYKKVLIEVKRNQKKIEEYEKNLADLTSMTHVFHGTQFQQKFEDLVKDYKSTIDIDKLKEDTRHLRAVSSKMKKVLENTNAEQQTKFQCFVCMDRYVDTFLDPCGHLMCSSCWNRSQKISCPACRTQSRPKRIYTLN